MYPFVWQSKFIFFGVPVSQFGLPFGTWHTAISCHDRGHAAYDQTKGSVCISSGSQRISHFRSKQITINTHFMVGRIHMLPIYGYFERIFKNYLCQIWGTWWRIMHNNFGITLYTSSSKVRQSLTSTNIGQELLPLPLPQQSVATYPSPFPHLNLSARLQRLTCGQTPSTTSTTTIAPSHSRTAVETC